MKKNLALVLALVMLMGVIFSVIPAAAAEATTSYEPKISHANINYSDKLYMMFAVPAPTVAIGAGNSVQLLVWNGVASEAYSFNDQSVEILSAEADKALIGGAWHYVFKYDGLTAADMTKIISARPVIVNTWEETIKVEISPAEKNEAGEVIKEAVYEDKIEIHKDAVKYGDLVEYSVLEYVATAKGEFGDTALAKDVIKMLDSMLNFGGLAQIYSGGEYDFLANDKLSKIWYVPVINGVEGDKVFGGFFKNGTELVTVSAPHLDNYSFVSYLDADGNAVYDIDGLVDNGDQVPAPASGDLVIKVDYSLLYMCKPDANKATDSSTNLYDEGTGNKWTSDKGGLGINLGAGTDTGDFNYSALDVVDDPYQAGNKVYRVVGNTKHNMGPGDTTNDWKVSLKPSIVPGFNDTVDPIITIDIVVGRGANGDMMRTGKIKLRSGSNGETAIGYFTNDGTFMLYTNGGSAEPLPVKVAETGYTRYVFVVDFIEEVIYAYAAENADDALLYQGITTHPEFSKKGKHFKENAWMDWAMTLDRLEWWGESGNNFTEEEKNGGLLADLDGDGVGETPMINADGQSNKAAIKWCFENYKPTMLVKEYCAYVGTPVNIPPAKQAYTATPNKAQIGSYVGGWMTSNNSFTWNADAGVGVLPSKAEAGNYWGAKIVADPFNEGEKVISLAGNANTLSTFLAGSNVDSYKVSASIATHVKTFGVDTYPMFTLDVTVGGNGADRILKTGALTFRSYAKDDFYLSLGYLDSDGTFYVYSMTKDENGNAVGFNVKASFKINLNGYTRIAFQFDVAGEELKVYAEQDGKMTLITTLANDELCFSTGDSKYYGFNPKPYTKIGDTWADWVKKAERIEWINDMTGGNALTEADLTFAVDVNGDGVADRAFNDDGTVANKDAAEIFFHTNRALLIKDLRMYVGMYER